MARVLVISDTQVPFEHRDYLSFLKTVQMKYRTTEAVHVGDEVDFNTLSDYGLDPDGMSPGFELSETIRHLKLYYAAFPKMKICYSNHAARLWSKAFRSGIPKICLRSYRDIIEAPKEWLWQESWEIDGVRYLHGKGYSGTMGALNAAKDKFQPTVIGHLHADAGILYFSNGEKVIYGLNVGCGIDAEAYAFNYGRDCRKKPIISCGVVIDGRPQLLRMHLSSNKRWDGEV